MVCLIRLYLQDFLQLLFQPAAWIMSIAVRECQSYYTSHVSHRDTSELLIDWVALAMMNQPSSEGPETPW